MGLLPLLALLFLQSESDGIKALDAQKYDEAVQIFSKLASAQPKDYSAHFYLGLAYSLMNRDSDAIGEYKKVLELKPGLYEAQLNTGILLVRQKQMAEALAYLEQAAKAKPNEFRPNLYLGDAYLGANQADKAEQAYKAAQTADPKSGAAALGLGRALAQQKKYADAEAHFRKAAELDPSLNRSLLELASIYEAQKRMPEAMEIYRKFPDDPAVQERLGELLLESGKAADAIPQLEEAVNRSPTAANLYALATAYLANHESSKAIPLLQTALQQEPNNLELRLKYARALRDEKKYPAAAQEFYTVTQRKPDSVEAWGELAGMLILLQQDQQALAALDKVKTLGGEKPGHFYLRAILYDRNKQFQPALDNYEKFLSMSNGRSPDEEFKARQRARILKKEISKR